MTEELTFRRGKNIIAATLYGNSKSRVVLCPPHPQYGGSREDSRLVAIASELAGSGMSALCLDYSVYSGGAEEIKDILFVLESVSQTMISIGLVGYSYGAVVASYAAAQFPNLKGLVLVSPLKTVNGLKIDLTPAVKKLIIYGIHDNLVNADIDEVYNMLPGEKQKLSLDTDHFYFGYEKDISQAVVKFFRESMQ